MIKHQAKPYWFFTILVSMLLILPSLVQKGMFLDGVTYAAISKNLANGIGTFYEPHYTKMIFTPFYEHPPLAFGIQAVFFKIFGDSFLIEKIYSLLTGILSVFGIIALWNLFVINKEHKKHSWFPVFIWITIPTIFWAYPNNILENTMGVFILFSVLFISKAMQKQGFKSNLLLFLGAFFVWLAFLSKGITGIFPLVVPLLYGLSFKINTKETLLKWGCFLVFITIIVIASFVVFPELKGNIGNYLEVQLFPSVKGEREITTTNRFKIILDLLVELTFPVLLVMVFYFLNRRKSNTSFKFSKESIYFLLIGISSSLPMIVTLKQRKFYLVPSIPFYVLSLSILLIPFLYPFLRRNVLKIDKINYIIIAILILLTTQFNGYLRDKEQLEDVHKIANNIPKGTIFSVNNLSDKWLAIAYFSRFATISLTEKEGFDYLLNEKGTILNQEVAQKYKKIELNLKKYTLYKLKGKNN